MNTDRPSLGRGACPECGKFVMLRNSDGMISKHGPNCLGSLRKPSQAALSEFVRDWAPPRRSE